MLRRWAFIAFGLLAASLASAQDVQQPTTRPSGAAVAPVLNFTMNSLTGQPINLSQYQGKVILIVNVASKCGNTPQYKPLEALYTKYAPQGFVILGVPSNDFHEQEPGTDADISEFCKKNYGVTFDMFSKVDVKGDNICPLYKLLTSTDIKYITPKDTIPQYHGDITWNFEKFLVARDGTIAVRFAPKVQPDSDDVVAAIEAELAK
jgi:glutathione peroxidase